MTILLPSARLGAQQPRLVSRPPFASEEAGQEAIELAASAGLMLDPWQQHDLKVMLAERADGNWAAFETADLVARQNGKGALIEAIELAALFLFEEQLVMHSAHEFKTSKEAFLRIRSLIEGSPDLSRHVRQFRQSNEETGVELMSGARLKFMARARSTGRGFSGQRLILDEAQILSFQSIAALMPTMSAQENPQINAFGTVPDVGDCCEYFQAVRDRGRAGDDPSLAWMEHTPGGTKEECEAIDLDDRDVWAMANSAMGIRISEEAIARERLSMDDASFARERLSIWPTLTEERGWALFDESAWNAGKITDGTMTAPYTYAVEVTPDRDRYSISVAGLVGDRIAVECGENDTYDEDAVLARLVKLHGKGWKALLIDPRSPAGTLIRPLKQLHNIDAVEVTTAQYAEACQSFYDDHRGDLAHSADDPALDGAVAAAKKKTYSGGWLFDRAGRDITPLSSAALARWGHLEIEEPPGEIIF